MNLTGCHSQLDLFEVGRQQVTVTFDGGNVVTDAGLLPIRELDRQLGILDEAARRLPDPVGSLHPALPPNPSSASPTSRPRCSPPTGDPTCAG